MGTHLLPRGRTISLKRLRVKLRLSRTQLGTAASEEYIRTDLFAVLNLHLLVDVMSVSHERQIKTHWTEVRQGRGDWPQVPSSGG